MTRGGATNSARTLSPREFTRSNIVAALAQLVDDAAPQLARDRLTESLSDQHTFLRDHRQLLDELLASRPAVEAGDLAQA